MSYSQEDRPLKVTTPLGEDVLLLERFRGAEAISTPFYFHLTMVSENRSLDLTGLLRQGATIAVRHIDGQFRYIHGLVRRAHQAELDMGLTTYTMEMVPWFWFLKLSADCRIFQNKTVPQIIEKVFTDLGYSDFKLQLYGSYPEREYVVQYRESHFDFVSRLMEEEGIFYFFEHSEDKHVMVLADSPAAIQPCPVQDKAKFARHHHGTQEDNAVMTLDYDNVVRTGKIALNDFNFEQLPRLGPPTHMLVNETGRENIEIYDYPGKYEQKGDGERYARIRLEEQELPFKTVRGTSDVTSFVSGYKFTLEEHFRDDLNDTWALLAVEHFSSGNNYRTDLEEPYSYQNTFTAFPATVQYRPPRVTPKPRIYGSQTAIVTGPPGEEIWCDKYGRVKVQFHWDREGKYDEKSSCWIRPSHGWAGKNWGFIAIPRMGHEVIVDHLEGDPDRPIITGRVYNADHIVPYKLPDNQTVTTFKSRSSKKGDKTTWNEIRMEDKKGEEQLFLHAEKMMDVSVEEDYREHIQRDSHRIVERNQYELVKGESHTEQRAKITHKGVEQEITVTGSVQEKIGTALKISVGQTVSITAGTSIVLHAPRVSIVGAGGFVDVGPGGVAIQGTLVLINSGGSAGSASAASPGTPDPTDTADDGSKFNKIGQGGQAAGARAGASGSSSGGTTQAPAQSTAAPAASGSSTPPPATTSAPSSGGARSNTGGPQMPERQTTQAPTPASSGTSSGGSQPDVCSTPTAQPAAQPASQGGDTGGGFSSAPAALPAQGGQGRGAGGDTGDVPPPPPVEGGGMGF